MLVRIQSRCVATHAISLLYASLFPSYNFILLQRQHKNILWWACGGSYGGLDWSSLYIPLHTLCGGDCWQYTSTALVKPLQQGMASTGLALSASRSAWNEVKWTCNDSLCMNTATSTNACIKTNLVVKCIIECGFTQIVQLYLGCHVWVSCVQTCKNV